MGIEQVEARERRASGAWSAASATAGAGLWLVGRWTGQRALAAFGAESLLQSAVGGGRVAMGVSSSSTEPSEVRHLYTLSVTGDLVAIAGGALLTARPEAVPRWLVWPYRPGRHQRGRGLALLVQGLVLLTIEVPALRRARALDAAQIEKD